MATSKTSGRKDQDGNNNEEVPSRDEAQEVIDWRFQQLVFSGWGAEEAEKVSQRFQGPEAIDLHEAMELVKGTPERKGCPPELAAKILL